MGIPTSLSLSVQKCSQLTTLTDGKASEHVNMKRRGEETVQTLLKLQAATQSCWSESPEVKGQQNIAPKQ